MVLKIKIVISNKVLFLILFFNIILRTSFLKTLFYSEPERSFFILYPQLFDVVYREETLLNVMRSVTRNGWSIILTAALALILVYLFSIIGYTFFNDDFLVDVPENVMDWGE